MNHNLPVSTHKYIYLLAKASFIHERYELKQQKNVSLQNRDDQEHLLAQDYQ